MDRLIVALVQMQSGNDKEQNVSTAERLVHEAAGKGASIVALPEYFSFGAIGPQQKEVAESVEGPTGTRMRQIAAATGVYLVGGSIAERDERSGKVFNTSLFIDPKGEIIAAYRKIHPFDLEVDDETTLRESDYLQPGDTLELCETGYGAIGLTICYDLRFPEIYRALALEGARIIFVVSSFMALTGRDHWEPLLRARAIENQVFIAAPNQAGPIPGTELMRHGHSMIIDPWGNILSQAADAEQVVTAEIDFDYLAKVRKQLPTLSARRPDIYRRNRWH